MHGLVKSGKYYSFIHVFCVNPLVIHMQAVFSLNILITVNWWKNRVKSEVKRVKVNILILDVKTIYRYRLLKEINNTFLSITPDYYIF